MRQGPFYLASSYAGVVAEACLVAADERRWPYVLLRWAYSPRYRADGVRGTFDSAGGGRLWHVKNHLGNPGLLAQGVGGVRGDIRPH